MATIPTLTTSRLILRPMGMGDWNSYRCFMASDRARHMGGPFTLAVAWGMFCADHAQWSLLGCGALMIEHRQSGGCLGQVGINHGPQFPERELGWLVFPEAEGHGFAFEAATALRAWVRETQVQDAGQLHRAGQFQVHPAGRAPWGNPRSAGSTARSG
jgi:RimJ/RimL family protein N-acetyltransferase